MFSRYLQFALLALTFNLGLESMAMAQNPALVCAHHQLCNLTHSLLAPSERERLITAFQSENSDPHDAGLAPSLLKSYYEATYLILPDGALATWLATVLKNRGPENTFVAEVSTQYVYNPYPGAHAHFWLYEEETCALTQALNIQLIKWGFKTQEESASCSRARFKIAHKKIKTSLSNQFLILTHNALAPLLESLGAKFIILRGAGHAHEISPEIFKQVHLLLKDHPSVTWIIEKEIALPPQLASLIRDSDKKVSVKVSGNFGKSLYAPLEELTSKLEELHD